MTSSNVLPDKPGALKRRVAGPVHLHLHAGHTRSMHVGSGALHARYYGMSLAWQYAG